jgi:hypothetical protein
VALVFSVVGEATALSRECADEVGVLGTGCLKLLPEIGAPAALEQYVSFVYVLTRRSVVDVPDCP